MRIPTRTFVTACALSAALLVAGCGGNDDGSGENTASDAFDGEILLQPVAARGPDPFTESTVTAAATPPRVTRTPQSTAEDSSAPGDTTATAHPARFPGGTPGLYGGTRAAAGCDVDRQARLLAADPRRTQAFARAAGIAQAAVPDFLRGLTSVVLRADTRVTDHGYQDGRVTGFQSVLQAGTAVLVDDRGVPRLRCACGNPLNPPVASRGTAATRGQSWPSYRPGEVIEVTPAPAALTGVTIIDLHDNTWIERRIGDDGHRDVVVRPPEAGAPDIGPSGVPPTGPDTSPQASPSASGPTGPGDSPSGSGRPPEGCATPTVTVPPGPTGNAPDEATPAQTTVAAPPDCPTATVTSSPPPTVGEPPATPPDEGTVPGPDEGTDPDTLPELPGLPDDGGPVPDESPGGGTVFDAPTDVFDS
ncbi:DUF6777 domain-containing protein [Streptomyces sp. NBC_01176]|uniref:DUF6777 domain-containing protein n=1 Tax=Streptomyces sp. NBC_01176 TaxID=2903760 RepID=UPI003863841A|nr:hypothetical protein OG199_07935 [Streptomyces sp. NBC_01176]